MAAKNLHVSQPSLSSQLKVLEESFNSKLFKKVGRTNELSRTGSLIYSFCKSMFEISEQLTHALSENVPTALRKVHVGISAEIDRAFMAEVVCIYLRKQDYINRPEVVVVSGTHDELVERLRFRDLDAIITESGPTELEFETLIQVEVPVVLICSTELTLKSKKLGDMHIANVQETVKALLGEDPLQWIMPSAKFKLRGEINRFLDSNGISGRVVMESDVLAMLTKGAMSRIGLSFLPLLYVSNEIQEGLLQPIGPAGGYWKNSLCFATHKFSKGDPVIDGLCQTFKDVCGAWIST